MIGVRKVVFTRAAQVEKSYFQTKVLEPENIRHYQLLGLEQAISTYVPEVKVYNRFKNFLKIVGKILGARIIKANGLDLFSELKMSEKMALLRLTELVLRIQRGHLDDFDALSYRQHDAAVAQAAVGMIAGMKTEYLEIRNGLLRQDGLVGGGAEVILEYDPAHAHLDGQAGDVDCVPPALHAVRAGMDVNIDCPLDQIVEFHIGSRFSCGLCIHYCPS